MTTLFNISKTKTIRQALRKQDIACEKILWSRLKNKQLEYKFRRQFGVGYYVIDFYCPRVKLAIEIDGATHATEDEVAHDKEKTKFLEYIGIKVKRYANTDIRKNLNDVLGDIYDACEALENRKTLPRADGGRGEEVV